MDKDKKDKLERKLEKREVSLYELLQEEIAIEWFRKGHPAFLAMLDSQSFG